MCESYRVSQLFSTPILGMLKQGCNTKYALISALILNDPPINLTK